LKREEEEADLETTEEETK